MERRSSLCVSSCADYSEGVAEVEGGRGPRGGGDTGVVREGLVESSADRCRKVDRPGQVERYPDSGAYSGNQFGKAPSRSTPYGFSVVQLVRD
jgi:hypothetical protein